ncbi:MAG: P22 coat protein - protein 5 domain protein [Ruminococcaceae bacterium]|nr:P22 coat protein - protein 5 domain protein [Oscillospiraceae bacterium]
MSVTNFIPTVWSEVLYSELAEKYVGVANCNREFEGDIKEMGSSVKICGLAPVSVFQYTKNSDMSAPETLDDTVTTLSVDRATAFNFIVDDVDRVQALPGLMNSAMKNAADALANDADAYVYALYNEIADDRTVTDKTVSAQSIVDDIIAARELLYDGNVTNASDIVIEVSPAIASLILKAKLLYGTSDNATTLANGYIGSICGCAVHVSKNIVTSENAHKCFVRTKRAIAFADQFTEICAYRPENRFADAVKGLHLYGAKIVYPKELVLLDLTVA